MTGFSRYLPWVVVGFAALYLVVMASPHEPTGPFHLDEFARLPVVDRGRVKPLDTLARNSLMVISNRAFYTDDKRQPQPAVRWLLDTLTSGEMLRNDAALQHKVFRIENDQVLNLLNLEVRLHFFRYSLNEIQPRMKQLVTEANRANERDPKQRDLFDQKVLELAQHIQLFVNLANLQELLVVPPPEGDADWRSLLDAILEMKQAGQDDPSARAVAGLLVSYRDGKADEFNKEVAAYRQRLHEQMPEVMSKVDFEVFFNHFEPFYQCTLLYVCVFLLALLSWMAWGFGWESFTQPLSQSAFRLAVLTLVVHTGALVARMSIMGRPPVTNLYSSAVFVGWGCVILGLVLEVIYHYSIGSALAALTGALSLILAHNLAAGGDTMEMLQAVLDTNFWLSTHVTIVNTGYAATMVAGFLGVGYILAGLLTPTLTRDGVQVLGRMIYGVLCFATLFSFTGTVLGGIWGDQSWGRFWGWDPKENGALLIVLWNALILHARWGGLVKQRGMAVLAVFGNIITAWSWFGTNMLGVGLHSYGFMSGAVFWLIAFDLSQLLVIAAGLVPTRYWWSFRVAPRPQPQPKDRMASSRHGETAVVAGRPV
jgi:ABC-type transport system involved in cytochrome c biogenesis permease subunit